jgi:YfiH family protein
VNDIDTEYLCDPVLIDSNVLHGFGVRGSQVPESTAFPRQIHGVEVATARVWSPADAPAADAIISSRSAPCVGIVTADCVPILIASVDGSRVAAIHAGWRGLAAGVIEAGLAAFREATADVDWVAAVGPAARGCCYEVDEPVRHALSERYSNELDSPVLRPRREGHHMLDLPLLATRVLEINGANFTRIGTAHRVCTVCDPERFDSYRRDGTAADRLRHFIAAREPISGRVDSPGGHP